MIPFGAKGSRYWPSRLKNNSSLANGLVFAFAGHYGLDLVNGLKPVENNVQKSTYAGKRSWRFAGGNVGNSDLNFGANTFTGNLSAGACTFAFYMLTIEANRIALAAQNDGGAGGAGWQIYCSPSAFITAEFERSTGNVQKISALRVPVHQLTPVVVTYDGGANRSGINIYVNNVPDTDTINGGTNGSGTIGNASGQPLYLGRRIFNTPLSHKGDILVALFANRAWNAREVEEFTNDPYCVFQRPKTFAFNVSGGHGETAVFDSPDAAASISSDATVVFDVTAPTGFVSATARVTDDIVTSALAWSLSGGFQSGYYGTTNTISNGYRVYLHRTGGWVSGALTVDLTSVGT